MKRSLFVYLLLAAMSLTACSGDMAGKPVFSDEIYQYINVMMETGGSRMTGTSFVLCRFNVLTGGVTPLCADPLCNHTEESGCFFYGTQYFTVQDNIIYFTRNISEGAEGIFHAVCSYNIADDKYKELYRSDLSGGSSCFLRHGYFWCSRDEGEYAFRIDLKNGEYEEIEYGKPFPSFEYDERYYYGEDSGTGIIHTVYSENKKAAGGASWWAAG